MNRPRLLDLYCGVGGSARGYQLAGFHVTGVDHRPQPRYCGDVFVEADALEYCAAHGHEFDVVHASPPCQAYSILKATRREWRYPDLVPACREALEANCKSWVMENVPGAPLRARLLLCGTMFGIRSEYGPVRRHRLFEANWALPLSPASCNHSERAMNVYTSGSHRNGTERAFIDAMGVTWASTMNGLEAIPPAYTEFIGHEWKKILDL